MTTDVLLADLGGTNVRFALADGDSPAPLRTASIRRYRVADFASLADAAFDYLREIGATPRHGVFAVAGRVDGDSVRITNHPWLIGIEDTRRRLALDSLRVRNDFAAMAMALTLLREQDVHTIGAPPLPVVGGDAEQTFAVVGPGTGLGVGALLHRRGQFDALQTEGGHVAFAPGTPQEDEVLRVLRARHGRVSVERLVSGMGLRNLYLALCEVDGVPADEITPEDISARAIAREPGCTCARAVAMMAELLGAAAGDFVLAYGAWDGCWLPGGLVPMLLPWLQDGGFRRRFEDKGRFTEALQRVPAIAVLHPDAGLLGAAAIARLQLHGATRPS